jgi:hypothetical protein
VNIPILVLLASCVLDVCILAMLSPLPTACFFAFMTAAFPKSGIKPGAFPFPVFLFGIILVVLLARQSDRRLGIRSTVSLPRGTHAMLSVYCCYIVARGIDVAASGGIAAAAPLMAWTVIPPYLFVRSVQLAPETAARIRHSLELGFILASFVGAAQVVFGVVKVQLAGLTYAFGDDIAAKRNTIFTGSGAGYSIDYSKIPATYQNGNIFGLVAAVFASIAIHKICKGTARRMDYTILLCGLASVGFSGSRTAIIALGCACLYTFWLQRGLLGGRIKIVALFLIAWTSVLAVEPKLAERYSYGALASTGGAGRSSAWSDALSQMHIIDYFVGVNPWRPFIDGWVGVIMQIGICGVVLLTAVILSFRPDPVSRVGLVVLGVGAVFDGSNTLFPTWFIPAVLLGLERSLASDQWSTPHPAPVQSVVASHGPAGTRRRHR